MYYAEPLISVIMPVYNCERYILRSVISVLSQSIENIELIIVNDASTDNTQQVIEGIKDERIILINIEEKSGISFCLNKGIDYSSGKYIARMDADDMCCKERFEKQLLYLEENDLDVVGSFVYYIDEDDRIIGDECFFTSHDDIVRFSTRMRFDMQHPTIFLKSEILKQNKYNTLYDCAEDYELFSRLFSMFKFGNVPEYLLYYRRHSVQTSLEFRNRQKTLAREIAERIAMDRDKDISLFKAYDNDWHNITFLINYYSLLYNARVVVFCDEKRINTIRRLLTITTSENVSTNIISDCDGENVTHIIPIRINFDYVLIAMHNWYKVRKRLLDVGIRENQIVYAFYCRNSNGD